MRVEGRGRETRIAERAGVCGVDMAPARNSSSSHDARKAALLGSYRRVRDLPRLLPLWSQPILDPDEHFDRDPTRALWLTEKVISALIVEISRHEIAANSGAASRNWDEARVGELCLAMAAERLTAAWMIRALAQMAEAQA